MKRHAITVIFFAAATTTAAQTPSSSPPAFEVASIKVNASGDENFGFTPKPGGVMIATNVTVRQIVTFAYSMQNSRVEGGPGWLDTLRFDITAKASEAATPEQMLLMLRRLLADRFTLALHVEPRDTPIFALVRARADRLGPQLRASSVDCDAVRGSIVRGGPQVSSDGRPLCAGRARAGFITAGGVSMEELARNMARLVGRVIVDRTGLQGRYDFDLKFAPDAELTAVPGGGGAPAELPSLLVALEEQLGLKLESQRAPVDVVIIDSIQRPIED